MKRSRWLSVLACLWLALLNFVPTARAGDPPWPPSVLVIAIDPCGAEEGSDQATFVVVRTGFANAPLTVQYALGGSADNGIDYEHLSGSVTIPQGAYFETVCVTPIDDFLVEGAESVVIALQQPPTWPPPYIVTWPSVAFAQIADNDFPPTNQPPQVAIIRPPDGSIFDAYYDIPIVAKAFDADGRVVTVEFFAGTNSLGIVTNRPFLTAVDFLNSNEDPTFDVDADVFPDLDTPPDAIQFPRNLFRLIWSNAPPGDYALTALATDDDGATTRSAVVNIKVLDPPPQPVVTVRATDPVATEPNPWTDYLDTATFTIHRNGPTHFPLEVFYRLGGTALNGLDYSELPYRVEIPVGERLAEVVVKPLDDILVEGPEKVVLSIVEPICVAIFPPPPDCYIVGRSHTARAVIFDNDTPPNRPPVVRLVKPEDGDVFVAPADIRLAALARDYDGFVTTVEFFEGTNSLGTVTNGPATTPSVPPFTLVWSNVPPGHYVLTAVATDDDGASTQSRPVEIKVVPRVPPPIVNIRALNPEAAETHPAGVPNPAVFSVTRTGGTQAPLLVYYGIGGTAENGLDYQRLSGRVLIPSGAESNTIVVGPIDDSLVEGIETVVLKLEYPPILSPTNISPALWYRIGSNGVARAFIKDNDVVPTNLPPRIAIVHPNDGDVFESPLDLRLAAAAHDLDGWVRTVEFFDGGTSLGIVTNNLTTGGLDDGGLDPNGLSPEQLFFLLWRNVPPGPHVLTAKATDNRGAMSGSDPVRIKVLPPPRPPIVTIYATDPYASEGNLINPWPIDKGPVTLNHDPKTAAFTVVRRGETNEDLTVYYKLEGTAGNGIDYRPLSGQVKIPRGAYRANIVVVPIDDIIPEHTETVLATLTPVACSAIDPPPPGCYVVGDPNRALAYIFDNDFNRAPKLEIVHPEDGDVFRAYSDIEIDVVARDPDGWVTTVQFYEGRNLIGEQSVHFIVPPPPGQPQRFSMVWSNVPPGDYVLTTKATDNLGAMSLSDPVRIKVAILPPLPAVTIHTVDAIATEPNPLLPVLPDTAKFKVARTGSLAGSLTVLYRISGTASNGVDYKTLSGHVTIPMNSATAVIEVEPLDDNLFEGTESVILSLVQPPCVTSNTATLGCYLVGEPRRAIAYIRDNDSPPNKPPTVAIVSPANGAVFSAPLDLRLVAAADDRDGWVTTVEFFDGNTSLGVVTNRILIIGDPLDRLPGLGTDVVADNVVTRPFSLIWSNVPPGRHMLTAVATDNDGDSTRSRPIEITLLAPGDLPVVRIMAIDPIAREGTSNTAAFRIRRTGPTNAPLEAFYAIRGTASNGVDYVTIANSVVIPAGRRSARVLITPLDDNLPERIETVRLRLTLPPVLPATYEIGRPARAGALILDNDCPILATQIVPDDCVHLRMPVPVGMPYRLEATTNFLDWETVVADITAEDNVYFVEDETGDYPHRFFRAVPEYGDWEEDD